MPDQKRGPGQVVAKGTIRGPEAGGAVVVEVSGSKAVLRLEDFWIAEGAPDVRVYLTPDSGGNVGVTGVVEFGKVTAPSGSLAYDIPDVTPIRSMRAVVVYCKAFGVTFGVAELGHLDEA